MSYLSEADEKLIAQCVPKSIESAFEELWSDLLDAEAVDDDADNKRLARMLFKCGAWSASTYCSFAMMKDGLKGVHKATSELLAETHPGIDASAKH